MDSISGESEITEEDGLMSVDPDKASLLSLGRSEVSICANIRLQIAPILK